jgi:uncharacterized protein with PhoU and TrkA domain
MGTGDPIESMLIELKNNSEMMIDLAYSALIYGNVDVARYASSSPCCSCGKRIH